MSDTGFLASGTKVRERTILKNVYLWMFAGLSLTAAAAWWVISTPAVLQLLFGNGPVPFYALVIGEFILVAFLSRRIMTMSTSAAVGIFALYSVLNGITISTIFFAYTQSAIFQAFAVSAGMFAVMSLWAVTTKRDLSGLGHYIFMALIGLIIAGLVGLFFRNETFQLLYSAAGVILFTVLTAYDTQYIKRLSDSAGSGVGEADFVRLSILGALKLYLDFINMFLFLLRIFGRRR